MSTVDREHFEKAIHELLDIPHTRYKREPGRTVLNTIVRCIAEALHRGEEVYVKGFGKFWVGTARPQVIPKLYMKGSAIRSSAPIKFANRRRAFFTPSIQLMAMLNQDTPNFKEQRAKDIWYDE